MRQPSSEKTFSLLIESLSLKKLPRTGWVIAKVPSESVAEHSFGAAITALVLARMEKLGKEGEAALIRRILLHDLHEARIGDLTPEQKRKAKPDEARVEREMLEGTHLELEIGLLKGNRLEILAHDADKLDMLFQAIDYHNAGNRNMRHFIDAALGQIKSKSGRKLARLALARLKK